MVPSTLPPRTLNLYYGVTLAVSTSCRVLHCKGNGEVEVEVGLSGGTVGLSGGTGTLNVTSTLVIPSLNLMGPL